MKNEASHTYTHTHTQNVAFRHYHQLLTSLPAPKDRQKFHKYHKCMVSHQYENDACTALFNCRNKLKRCNLRISKLLKHRY